MFQYSGDNEVLEEIVQRWEASDTYVQINAAIAECSIVDESALHKSNPELDAGINSPNAMRFAVEPAAAMPSDIASFARMN